MRPVNKYATRTALTEWAGQSYVNKVDGVSLDPRLESFGSNTRLAIEVQRFGSYLTTIYAYGTAAARDADTGRDINVGSLVYSETSGPLAFWSGSAWTVDAYVVATAMRAALSAFAASLVILDGVPIPGPPGTTEFSDLDGLPSTLAGYGVSLSSEPFTPDGGSATTVGATLDKAATSLQPSNYSETFDKQADFYNENEPGAGFAARSFRTASKSAHGAAYFGNYYKHVAKGSGLAAGPHRADFAVGIAAFKEGFPSLTAEPGELNAYQDTIRQVRGDAAGRLCNIIGIDGFFTSTEAIVGSIDPVTYALKHVINQQDAVIDDRLGKNYGLVRGKNNGIGGTGILIQTSADGRWDEYLQFSTNGELHYEMKPDRTSWYYSPGGASYLQQVGERLYVHKADGTVQADLTAIAYDFVPDITVDSGTIDTTLTFCEYNTRGDWIDYTFQFTMNGYTGAPGQIVVELPVPAKAGILQAATGHNASNADGLFAVIFGSSMTLRDLGSGAFPAAPGNILIVTASYRIDSE